MKHVFEIGWAAIVMIYMTACYTLWKVAELFTQSGCIR